MIQLLATRGYDLQLNIREEDNEFHISRITFLKSKYYQSMGMAET